MLVWECIPAYLHECTSSRSIFANFKITIQLWVVVPHDIVLCGGASFLSLVECVMEVTSPRLVQQLEGICCRVPIWPNDHYVGVSYSSKLVCINLTTSTYRVNATDCGSCPFELCRRKCHRFLLKSARYRPEKQQGNISDELTSLFIYTITRLHYFPIQNIEWRPFGRMS